MATLRSAWLANVLFTGSLLFSTLAQGAAGWTSTGNIMGVEQDPAASGGYVLVSLSMTSPASCSSPSVFAFKVVDDRTRQVLAMLLAAQLASRSIQVYVTGNCIGAESEIDGIAIQ